MISASSNQMIVGIIQWCYDRCRSGNDWPPVLSEFVARFGGSQFDYKASFDRMIRHQKPIDKVEAWVFHDCDYQCRRASEKDARRMHKEAADYILAKVAHGEQLGDPSYKALPTKNTMVRNPIDDLRDKYLTVDTNKLWEKLQRLKDGDE